MAKQIIVSQKCNKQRMEEVESYLLRIHDDIADIRYGFIQLGFHLEEIKKCQYYMAAGYEDFYQFCEINYGLESTTVKRYIEVWYAFAEYDKKSSSRKMWIDEKYSGYSYSQLVELLPLDDKQRKQILPSMTIKEIRQKKKEMKEKKCDVAPEPRFIEPPSEPEEQPEVEKCDVAPLPSLQLPEEPEETELENQRNNMLNQLDRIQTAVNSASIFLTLEQQKNIFHEINVLMCMVQLLH